MCSLNCVQFKKIYLMPLLTLQCFSPLLKLHSKKKKRKRKACTGSSAILFAVIHMITSRPEQSLRYIRLLIIYLKACHFSFIISHYHITQYLSVSFYLWLAFMVCRVTLDSKKCDILTWCLDIFPSSLFGSNWFFWSFNEWSSYSLYTTPRWISMTLCPPQVCRFHLG